MRVRCGAALFLLLLLSGCSVSPLTQRATQFSTAATAATLKMQNAYQLVEQSFADMQTAELVNNFEKSGFSPAQIKPFMPTQAMQARTKMLAGLQQYATLLAEVSGNQPIAALDTQSKALGTALRGLSDSSGLTQVAANAHTGINVADTAVDALGRLLIERDREQKLPAILTQMQKPVDDMCQLLEADIGTPNGFGLRSELHSSYSRLIGAQIRYILDNEKTMRPDEKRAEIEKLPQMAATEKQDDLILQQTQAALKSLAEANDALVTTKGSKKAPAFRTLLSQLVAQGQQIGSVYSAMPK